jgi:uncharacterized membrane protein
MSNSRLEAFSDGVIVIMVLELKVPHGGATWALPKQSPAHEGKAPPLCT